MLKLRFRVGRSIFMTVCWVNRGCVDLFWLVQRVVRESGVAVVEQSVTASRYVDCVVPCKSVEFGRSTSSVMTICWINRGLQREPVVAVVEQCSLHCVVPCKSSRSRKGWALLGPLCYRTGTKALPCQPCEQWLLLGFFFFSKPCERADESEGFVG